jgi:hypothetical protein
MPAIAAAATKPKPIERKVRDVGNNIGSFLLRFSDARAPVVQASKRHVRIERQF